MNKGYAVFCDADRHFYDAPHRLVFGEAGSGGSLYRAAALPVPEGWTSHRTGDWLALRPLDRPLPPQGWKIHVSAGLDNAEAVLATVREYCLRHEVAFKFVPSRYLLHQRNAKYADRSASGKFITVYPADDRECERVATDLAGLLDGEAGPYILSDLRWGRGPVHLRYGSFTRRHCYDENGELRPALEDASGTLVPDLRGPVFHVPDWVTPPAFLLPHLAARAAVTVRDLPYDIEKALHFSNGGGVYEALHRPTGRRVVLKEARPYAGLAADGADAVTRLRREREALEKLSGLACTPEVLDSFTVGDHHFLALEFVEGKPLNTFFARRHPLMEADPPAEKLAEYTEWALRIHGLVERAVAEVHARGIVFNDLHLFNIMVSEDESSVVLLDFEAAKPAAEGGRQTVANPAFVAPADRRGFDVDRYALACLRIALFIPLTSLLAVDRAKAAHLAEAAAARFPMPPGFLDEAVREITREPAGNRPGEGDRVPARHPDGSRFLPVEPG
ncbi:class III lanthionine synthetase LanKC, partial [Streptomyces sp.]|uniref:class III lanthionine synthetase LanKC n=1 Tax=Streptomyces sp. TaxID=1931 RepID=UPI002811F37A